MADFNFEVVKKIGVIRQNEKSSIELRITKVNDSEAYDIRNWFIKDGKEQPGKGVRLTEEELDKLAEIINTMDLDEE